MPTFAQTRNPTPFGLFSNDTDFQQDADSMVIFVKRSLGDDVLAVECTSKQIWSCFEEATLEYARYINELRTINELVNVLGLPTGTTDLTNKYLRRTFEYQNRLVEPYSMYAGTGGSYNAIEAYFELTPGKQDYDIYTEMRVFSGSMSGSLVKDVIPSGSKGKLTILEVMHFEPLAAQGYLLNTSNISQFLASSFNYESYINTSVFYVYPVFEDVLRRQMLETSFRVRRSNFTYQIVGSKLKIFPVPTSNFPTQNLFVRVLPPLDPASSGDGTPGSIAYEDESVYGVSGPSNVPFNVIPYSTITEPGRQWIRQFTLALCKELLGLIRSKFSSIPVPNAEVTLNGEQLVQQGREDKQLLRDQIKEFLSQLTVDKITERETAIAENLLKQLQLQPMPLGKAIGII